MLVLKITKNLFYNLNLGWKQIILAKKIWTKNHFWRSSETLMLCHANWASLKVSPNTCPAHTSHSLVYLSCNVDFSCFGTWFTHSTEPNWAHWGGKASQPNQTNKIDTFWGWAVWKNKKKHEYLPDGPKSKMQKKKKQKVSSLTFSEIQFHRPAVVNKSGWDWP